MGIQIGLSLTGQRLIGSFSPLSLFAGGQRGFWYDPSDLTTLFQDSAGTTPVTAAGQSVGLIRDKSGNANHASQATTGQRPVYQVDGSGRPYLLFDGVDDGLATASFTWGSDAATMFAGAQKDADGTLGYLADFNDYGGSVAGSFAVRVPGVSSPTSIVAFASRGSTSSVASAASLIGYNAPKKLVVYGNGSTSAPLAYARANGTVEATPNTSAQGAVSYGPGVMRVGGRVSSPTSSPFLGRIYGLIAINRQLSVEELAIAEAWMNGKTGAY